MEATKQVLRIEEITATDLLQSVRELFTTAAASINPPKDTTPEFITRKEVADMFGISLPTVHAWIHAGILTAYKIGNKTRFRKSEVMAACKPLKNL